jgi:hypothetical protein
MNTVVTARRRPRPRTRSNAVQFRTRGKDGDGTICAISFDNEVLMRLTNRVPHKDAIRLGLKVFERGKVGHVGAFAQELHVIPNPEGFLINHPKPTSRYGEIHVPWSKIPLKCTDPTGKGALEGTWYSGQLILDVTAWKLSDKGQDELFPSWGTMILPG